MRNILRCAQASFAMSLLSISVAAAMEMRMYDRLSASDQGTYVALMITGAHKILVDAGRNEEAVKFSKLFNEVRPGDQMSVGMLELEANIDNVRVLDADRYAKDHSVQRLEVEQAMALTLKRNGIVMPKAFMHVNDGFKPRDPLQNE